MLDPSRATSVGTKRGYKRDYDHFSQWCGERQVLALPAEVDTIMAYILDLSEARESNGSYAFKASTIYRRTASICRKHVDAGLASPRCLRIGKFLGRLKHDRIRSGEKISKAAPITLEGLRLLIGHLREFDDAQARRDRAMVLVAWACALRRSELTALNLEDIAWTANGAEILIRRSKGDQVGLGRTLPLNAVPNEIEICPVRALREWLDIRPAFEGSSALFWDYKHRKPLLGKRPCDIRFTMNIGKWCKRARLPPGPKGMRYSAHSLRAGYITTAIDNGAAPLDVTISARHKSVAFMYDYVRTSKTYSGVDGSVADPEPMLLEQFRESARRLLPLLGGERLRQELAAITDEVVNGQ